MAHSPTNLGVVISSQWIPGETIDDFSNTSSAASERTGKRKRTSESSETEAKVKPYECRFCPMKFSKSQALGGHMNRHRQEREQEQLIQAQQLVMQQGFTPMMIAGRSSSPSTSISLELNLPFQRPFDSAIRCNDPLKASPNLTSDAVAGLQPHFQGSSGFLATLNWNNFYDPLDHNQLNLRATNYAVAAGEGRAPGRQLPYGADQSSSSSLLPCMNQHYLARNMFNNIPTQDMLGMTTPYEKRMHESTSSPRLENNILVDEWTNSTFPIPRSGTSSHNQLMMMQSRGEAGDLSGELERGASTRMSTPTQVNFPHESDPPLQLGPANCAQPLVSQAFPFSAEGGYQFLPQTTLAAYDDYAYPGLRSVVNAGNPLCDLMPNTSSPLEGISSNLVGDRNMGTANSSSNEAAAFKFSLKSESMMDPTDMAGHWRIEFDPIVVAQRGEAASSRSSNTTPLSLAGEYPGKVLGNAVVDTLRGGLKLDNQSLL